MAQNQKNPQVKVIYTYRCCCCFFCRCSVLYANPVIRQSNVYCLGFAAYSKTNTSTETVYFSSVKFYRAIQFMLISMCECVLRWKNCAAAKSYTALWTLPLDDWLFYRSIPFFIVVIIQTLCSNAPLISNICDMPVLPPRIHECRIASFFEYHIFQYNFFLAEKIPHLGGKK